MSSANQRPAGSSWNGASISSRPGLDIQNLLLALCVVFFAALLVNTRGMEVASSYLLPRLVCVVGMVVGIVKLASTLLRQPSQDSSVDEEQDARGLDVVYSIAFATVYFVATRWLGFILATFVAILSFSYLTRYSRKKLAVVLAIVVPLLLHLAFVTLLQASLPAGIVESLLF